MSSSTPLVFISYSWDSAEHKQWVSKFARDLTREDIRVILDQWEARPGDDLCAFMDRSISTSDFVLIICTDRFKRRSSQSTGGAGYESTIISGEILVSGSGRKFIPILRDGEWIEVAPGVLKGKYFIDLRDGPYYRQNFEDLVRALKRQDTLPDALGAIEFPTTNVANTPETTVPAVPLRNYVYISTRKIDSLFPQIPADFVRRYENVFSAHTNEFRVHVLLEYLEASSFVGTIETPRAYFKGRIKSNCLLTSRGVVFASEANVVNETRYVCVSGSLEHMTGRVFQEIYENGDRGYLERSQWESLRSFGARYLVLNSNTVEFHDEISRVATEVMHVEFAQNEQNQNEQKECNRGSYVAEPLTKVWHRIQNLDWFRIMFWLFGFFLIGLFGLSVVSWRWIGIWALVPIIPCALFLIVYVLIAILFLALQSGSNEYSMPKLEDRVRDLARDYKFETQQEYDFVARTVLLGESEGETVIIGSPIYMALAEHGSEPA